MSSIWYAFLRNKLLLLIPLVVAVVAGACGTTTETVVETVIVEKVVTEKGDTVIQTVIVTEKGDTITVVATPTASAAAPPASKSGPEGTLIIAMAELGPPATVPHLSPNPLPHHTDYWGVYDSLTSRNPDGVRELRLASAWSYDSTGTELTIKLREGVQFHGGWGEVTADDAVWTWQDQMAEGSTYSNQGRMKNLFTSLDKVDKHTFKVTLSKADSFFVENYLGRLAGFLRVVSQNRIETLGVEIANTDLSGGTGPYEFVRWIANVEAEVVATRDHYRLTPSFERIKIYAMPEAQTVAAALLTGEIDMGFIAYTDAERMRDGGLDVRKFGFPASIRLYAQGNFCMKTALNGDPIEPRAAYDPDLPWVGECDNAESLERARQVRQALAMAIDRETMADVLLGDFGRPQHIAEILGPMHDDYMKPEYKIPYDPEAAKQMLDTAGYPNGFDTTIRVTTSSMTNAVEIGEVVQRYWREIGVEADLIPLTYLANRKMIVARQNVDFWLRPDAGSTLISPEIYNLRRSPLSSFNPGYEVRILEEAAIAVGEAKSAEAMKAAREELIKVHSHERYIIPIAQAYTAIATNKKKVGEWPMSVGCPQPCDLGLIQKPK